MERTAFCGKIIKTQEAVIIAEKKKKECCKPGPMTEGKRAIIRGLLQEYDIKSEADIQEALKELLGGTIKEM